MAQTRGAGCLRIIIAPPLACACLRRPAAQIEALCDRHSSTPPCPVIIEEAGELPPGTDLSAVPPVAAGGWPLWPEDQGAPPQGVREAAFRLDIAAQLKEAGNAAYKQVGQLHSAWLQQPHSS